MYIYIYKKRGKELPVNLKPHSPYTQKFHQDTHSLTHTHTHTNTEEKKNCW